MYSQNPDGDLRDALDAFETSLDLPVVAGELDTWCEQVQAAWNVADPQLHRHLTQLHPRQLREIVEADAALASEVDKLEHEGEALERDRSAIGRLVEELAAVAPRVEPDERKFADQTQRLMQLGVAFVARIKKQQVAIEAWYQEAFNRDHGVVD